ncbi:MAG: hypothetical protein ACXVBE_12000 [Bdellovibrionota bacterium]
MHKLLSLFVLLPLCALAAPGNEFANHMGSEMPNDGLVPAESQKLTQFQGVENFGTDMGVIPDRDHMDLFHANNTEHANQADIFRGIINKIEKARSAPGCAVKYENLSGN